MTTAHDRFSQELAALCDKQNPLQSIGLADLLGAIPRVDDLNLSDHDTVLIRADLDVPLKDGAVVDPTRLESCVDTIKHCLDQGMRVVLLGHIGRKPSGTLQPVVEPLSALLDKPVEFIAEWFDADSSSLTDSAIATMKDAKSGSVVLLENVRRYDFERALWKADADTANAQSAHLFDICQQISQHIAAVEINEAIAASNRDMSSAVLPLAMSRTGLGFFIYDELATHATKVIEADFLIFSGVKANKLDDLESIVKQGHVRDLIIGGALAMALVKAQGNIDGQSVSIGVVESNAEHVAYVAPERIEQAQRILEACAAHGTQVHLPHDYVLDDGTVAFTIPAERAQLDIGPETAQRYRQLIEAAANADESRILFINGVMGMVEDDRFETGTKTVLAAVTSATAAGLTTYVGGGDGRAALTRFESEDRVTHAFTAGGTILKLISGKAIPYLLAMYLQNRNDD